MPLPDRALRLARTVAVGAFVALMPIVPRIACAAGPADAATRRLFRERIEPVLRDHCYSCHSARSTKVRGGLLLDSRAGLLKGGDTGPAIVPGKSDESLLIQAIRHEGPEMPPRKPKLPDVVIADFVTWIDGGAVDPRAGPATAEPSQSEDEARRHWAFQPVKAAAPPAVHNVAWVRNPIDAFVLAKLETHHWPPAPQASRAEWIRRVTFDLTGLPPTPDEIDSFVNDSGPSAFERVADRLLASPHYGERWAQHWLDLIRFAESEGYEYDRHVPGAWRFRDYVITALNRDKPFDRFVTEQLAGDEIGPENPECLTASAFHRLGPVRRNAGNPDIALSRNEVLTERTDIIGSAFLGLTIGCARCHNHKLEPISQKDYYRLEAYLAATDEHNISLASAQEVKAWEQASSANKKALETLKAQARRATGTERERLSQQIEELEDQAPDPLPTIPSTRNNAAERTAIHVLKRGVWEQKGERVGPRPPSILVAHTTPELAADINNPRTHLARWLTAPDHPLTARVLVNRIWQHHFSAGLVKTVNDFGTKGDRPSHPELLDWLARSLVETGWRLKPLHRLIVLSQTYRQSSHPGPFADAERDDPENRLLWKFPRRRLEAEEIRDAMLAVSGRLNLKAGGPSVMVPVDAELVRLLYKPSQWREPRSTAENDRRSIYLIAKRNLRLPFMEAFDAPPLMTSCARRESSTHAPQALELLNGRLSNDLAAAFAGRLEQETGGDPERIVDRAFRLALGRLPNPDERAIASAFVRQQPLPEFALAVFNLNGFLYVP
jgi:hypothetical protein